jgi:hypothetical protein
VVVFITSPKVAPTLASARPRFENTCAAWALKSPGPTTWPTLSNATCPAM